ncbi:unnamed protein product [Effrenium voratum]|nr:unnamed protein product [Effrenium voratum]
MSEEPWIAMPFICAFHAVRTSQDFFSRLFRDFEGFAWFQLLVFILCTAGVVAGMMQVKFREHGCGAPVTCGLLLAAASIFFSGAVCHWIVPLVLMFIGMWIIIRLPGKLEASQG